MQEAFWRGVSGAGYQICPSASFNKKRLKVICPIGSLVKRFETLMIFQAATVVTRSIFIMTWAGS
jgi:hypothetical protein